MRQTGITVSRRRVLTGAIGAGALAGLSACGLRPSPTPVGAGAVAAAESARPTSGRVRSMTRRARPVDLDLGGRTVSTWSYGDSVPGTPLRATAGDRVRVAFANDLPEATSVHWHGLAIRNDMDGVPGVTTPEVDPGGSFDFDFVVPDSGTHWFHPHHGLQLDHGLYAPFIVDDPDEVGDYDLEWIVVLDDWTDGVGPSPAEIYDDLRSGDSGMGGMGGMGGMDGGDVDYPLYLANGRPTNDPDVLTARPGQRVRLRIINAGADTIFDVSLAEHDLSITHADGYAVEPVSAPAVRLGMGERYDALVTLADGVFPLVAQAVGKSGLARALIRTGAGEVPPENARPPGLDGDPLTANELRAGAGTALSSAEPDSVHDLLLSASRGSYEWTINGRTYDDVEPLLIREGERGRVRIRNHSMMPHPIHLHGHTFQLGQGGGTGPRKDTVLVPSMAGVDVDLDADNPGQWMIHCHNAYHAEAGMMSRLDYVT